MWLWASCSVRGGERGAGGRVWNWNSRGEGVRDCDAQALVLLPPLQPSDPECRAPGGIAPALLSTFHGGLRGAGRAVCPFP